MDALRRNTLLVFFFLAFLLSWWTWPFVLLNPKSAPLLHFGVLFAALITVAIAGGRAGVRSMLAQIVRWRVGRRWYAVALLLPVAAVAATGVVALVLGARIESASLILEGLIALPFALIGTTIFAGPLSEEPGWRGVALPRMMNRLGLIGTSLVIGLIWAAWHLPLFISDPGNQREPIPFSLAVMSTSVVLTWVYLASGRSLLLAILLHGMFNSIAAAVFPAFHPADRELLWWVFAAVWVVIGLGVATRLRGRTALAYPERDAPAMEAATA